MRSALWKTVFSPPRRPSPPDRIVFPSLSMRTTTRKKNYESFTFTLTHLFRCHPYMGNSRCVLLPIMQLNAVRLKKPSTGTGGERTSSVNYVADLPRQIHSSQPRIAMFCNNGNWETNENFVIDSFIIGPKRFSPSSSSTTFEIKANTAVHVKIANCIVPWLAINIERRLSQSQ